MSDYYNSDDEMYLERCRERCDSLEAENARLHARLEKAEEVLRFYADRTNYDTVDGSLHVYSERGLDRKMYRSLEFGDKARAYFAQKEGDGE